MNAFTLIWLIILFCAILPKDIRFMVYVLMISMILQCVNFISLKSLSCGPQIVTSIIFLIKSSFYKYERKSNIKTLNKKIFVLWLLFCLYIFLNMIFNNVFSRGIFLRILQLLIYVLTFIRLYKVSIAMDYSDIDKIIKAISFMILSIGFLLIIINLLNLSKDNILKYLLFNDNENRMNIFYYKNSTRFYSTFMEPSYVSSILVAFMLYFLMKKHKCSSDYIYIVLLVLAIVLSFSSTAYLLTFVAILYYILVNFKKRKILIFIPFIIICLFVCYHFNIFDEVLINKLSSSSGVVRTQFNNRALKIFKDNSIFGIGYKNSRASSIIFNLGAELGIIGISFYILIAFQYIKIIFKKNYSLECKTFCFMCIICFIGQIIACPDLDLCSFWLINYIFSLSLFFMEGRRKYE